MRNTEIESGVVIVDAEQETKTNSTTGIIVEIAGAVLKPGVYEMDNGSRIYELIDKAGGLDGEDTQWVERFVNKAGILTDGQKIVIPRNGEQSSVESDSNLSGDGSFSQTLGETQNKYVNINTASKSELESLWGIGPVYAQNIIDQRPYSNISELKEKSIIKSNVYERNKDILTVY